MEINLIDMHPIAILTRYAKLKKPLVYQEKMLEVIAILKRYGRHTPDCAITRWIRVHLIVGDKPVCDCGWDDIMEELK